MSTSKEGMVMICRPFITTRSGKRIYAWQKGKKAFCFWVRPKEMPLFPSDEEVGDGGR